MQIIKMILETAVPFLVTAVCSFMLGTLKSMDSKTKARYNADLVLLRDKLYYYYDRYINEDEMPKVLYENMVEMKQCYIALGGNGTVKKMCEELENKKLK